MVVPPKHPKMIIFSTKTYGCWVRTTILGNPHVTQTCLKNSSEERHNKKWKMIGCKKPTDVGDSSQTIQGPSRSGLRNRKMYLQHPVLMGRCDMIWYYYDIRMSCHILKKRWDDVIWVDMSWYDVMSCDLPKNSQLTSRPGALPRFLTT